MTTASDQRCAKCGVAGGCPAHDEPEDTTPRGDYIVSGVTYERQPTPGDGLDALQTRVGDAWVTVANKYADNSSLELIEFLRATKAMREAFSALRAAISATTVPEGEELQEAIDAAFTHYASLRAGPSKVGMGAALKELAAVARAAIAAAIEKAVLAERERVCEMLASSDPSTRAERAIAALTDADIRALPPHLNEVMVEWMEATADELAEWQRIIRAPALRHTQDTTPRVKSG